MKLLIASFGPYVYHVDFDPAQLSLSKVGQTPVGSGPSWIEAKGDYLFVTDETDSYRGADKYEAGSGAIVVFKGSGYEYTRETTILSGGASPTHIHVDNGLVYIANYDGAYGVVPYETKEPIQVFDLNEDASKVHLGPKKARQEKAHAHWIGQDSLSGGKFVYGTDLGQDRIYQFVRDGSKLVPNPASAFVTARAGTGPRHVAFHPSKPLAYVVHELDSTLGVYAQDTKTGVLSELAHVSTVPADLKDPSSSIAGAIVIDSAANFVYVTNREGANTIAVFGLDAEGKPSLVQQVPSGGLHPRHIGLSPDEKWLICSNQKSDRIDVFGRDSASGKLEWKTGLDGLTQANFTHFA